MHKHLLMSSYSAIFISLMMFLLYYFQTSITFELAYNAPDGSVGDWKREGFEYSIENEEIYDEDSNLYSPENSSDTESLNFDPISMKGSKLSLGSKYSRISDMPKSPVKFTQ